MGEGTGAWRRRRVPLLLGALVAAAGLWVLFSGRDAGLADNGDGYRYTCQLGLRPTRYIQHLSAWFAFTPVDTAEQHRCWTDPRVRYPSTWIAVVLPLVRLHALVGGRGFDLRWVGVLACLLLGVLTAALAASVRASRVLGCLAVAPLALVALDVTFLGYANAPYVEIGGLLAVLAAILALARCVGAPRLGHRHLLALGAAGAFLTAVKMQTVTFAAVTLLVLAIEVLRRRRSGVRQRPHGLGAVVAALLLVGAAGGEYALQGSSYWQTNQYNLLFTTALGRSGDPARDLRQMDLDPALAAYAGTQIWSPSNALGAPGYARARRDFSRADFVEHFARHPRQAEALLSRAALEVSQPRITRQADVVQPRSPVAHTVHRSGVAVAALSLLRPLGWPGLLVLWLGGTAVGLRAWLPRAGRRAPAVRQWAAALVFVSAAAPAQMATALLGDGYGEIRKHLVFCDYSTALALALLGVGAAVAVSGRVRGARRPEPRGALAVRPRSSHPLDEDTPRSIVTTDG